MNVDTTIGGSGAVGAMLSVLIAHFSGEEFSPTEMTALAGGFGAIIAAAASAIRAVWAAKKEQVNA